MKKRHPIEATLAAFIIAALVCQPLPLLANPLGATVVGGSATVNTAPGTVTVFQHTHKAIINWKDFSIGADEITKFVQPSASSAVLNRVIGLNPTKIFGTLEGNGRVYVINENGVLVGRSGVINTRSFVASTLDVSDSSFMNGAALRLAGDSLAGIRNEGAINALGGDVFLISRTIENAGTISAPAGTAGLGAGSEVILQPTGRERIAVVVGNTKAGQAATGIDNQGTIEAVSAELKAAGGNVYALAINNGGAIRATSLSQDESGRIVLKSSGGNIQNSGLLAARNRNGSGGSVVADAGHNEPTPATTENTGVIDVRGDGGPNARGGSATLVGDRVGILAGRIDASGHRGGGTVLVGGDYQGRNPDIQNAAVTVIGQEAHLEADALVNGDGGRVVVWSDELTKVYGSISAQGAGGGSGGFVETSSHDMLDLIGAVVNPGIGGLWLLDPRNVTIGLGGDAIPNTGGTYVPIADGATVDRDSINAALNNDADVIITTGVTGAEAGNITVNAAITKDAGSAATLTLQAAGNILVDAAISGDPGNPLNVVLQAGGNVTINELITTQTGDFTSSGVNFLNDVDGGNDGRVLTAGGNITLNHTGDITLDGRLNAGSGNIAITGSTLFMDDNGFLEGTGTLLLQPSTVGASIGVGTGAAGTFNLAGAELGQIENGFSAITIGRADGEHVIDIRASTFNDAVTVRAPQGAGSITVNGAITGAGTASVTLDGSTATTLNANITTANQDITINDNVVLGEGLTITLDTGNAAGNIAIAGSINGTAAGVAESITFDAGTGTISAGSIGNSVALDTVTVVDSGGATFSGGVTATTMDLQDTAGAVRLGTINLTTLTTANQSYSLELISGGTVTSDTTFLNTGGVTLGDDSLDVITFTGGLDTTAGGAGIAGVVNTTDTQMDLGTVTLIGNSVLNAGTAAINVGAIAGGGNALALNSSATVTLGGAATGLSSLTTDLGGTTAINGGGVTTSGNQTYNDQVTLGANAILAGANLTLGNVTGNNNDLSLNFSGLTTVDGTLLTGIRNLETGAGGQTIINGGSVTTTGTQIYNDAVTLQGDTALVGTTVTFNDTLNGTTAGQESLTITGNAVFGNGAADTVGGTASLEFLSVSGTTGIDGSGVTTAGAQTYAGNVTVGEDTVLTGTLVTFNGKVNGTSAGQESLTVNGNVVFGDTAGDFVGDVTSLQSLTVSGTTTLNGGNAGANTVTTAGGQSYGGTVTLGADTTLAGSTLVVGNVTGNNHDLALNFSGATSIDGATLSGIQDLTTGGGGQTTINGGGITTSGTQTYNDSVVLGADTVLGGTTVTFNNTLDATTAGQERLTVNGDAVFGGAVGGSALLESLNVSGATTVNGGSVATLGDQTYVGTVTLGADTTLSGASLSIVGVTGNNHDLALNFSGLTTISGGFLNGIQDLTSGGGGLTRIVGGGINTSGSQTYDDAVVLTADTTLGGTTITFNNTVDGTTAGQESLTINGNAVFGNGSGDLVGSVVALEFLTVSGTVAFNAGGNTVTTVGGQTYGGTATLGDDTTLTGSTLSLGNVVGNGNDLNLTFSGITTINAASLVGLANLTANGGGTTVINGGTVTTSGNQTYDDTVILTGDTTLSANTVRFNGTVDGTTAGTESLAIVGNAIFGDGLGDLVGASVSLESLTVSGTTSLNGGGNTVTTLGVQTYSGAVSLGASTTLTGNAVTFGSTVESSVDDASALQVNANASFGGAVGSAGHRLASLFVGGTAALNGGLVRTLGAQTYNGAATIGADTVLSGGAITFASTISGANDLTLEANNLSLGGAVNLAGQRVTINRRDFGDIDVGGADGAALGIDATELGFINADTLQIGDLANTQNIHVGIDVNRTGGTLALVNNGSISGPGVITASGLRIDSSGAVDLSATHHVTTLAANLGANNSLTFRNADHLTVGTVDGQTGIAGNGGTVRLVADGMDLNNAVNVGNQGTVSLEPLSPGVTIQLGGNGVDAPNLLAFTAADLGRVTARLLRIGGKIGEGVPAASINITDALDFKDGGSNFRVNDLALRSVGDVTQEGDAAITINNLGVLASGANADVFLVSPVNRVEGILAVTADQLEFLRTVDPEFRGFVDDIDFQVADLQGGLTDLSEAAAAIATIEIPLPKRSVVTFGSGGIETVPPSLPPGAIWTSYLQVPFLKVDESRLAPRLEDRAKFASGTVSILGSTTGPQTGK